MSVGFGYDKEYKDAEIAEVLDMSSERVRQLRKETIKKLASNVNIKTFLA
jgi:DNA-directed RNA polymerase sigma subunit (sigma70/sigma32)